MDELRGELVIMKDMLNSNDIGTKIEGLKRVIVAMTIGKNVAGLFQSVIKCLELPNLETKKLIYLYIINNSRQCPDDALMIVNQFCKDARDRRALIRALAIRTMGCLRVAKLNEYLIEPLVDGLKDSTPYVRKTAVLCVPKVFEVSRELVTAREVPGLLRDLMMNDPNPSVVAASLVTLKELATIAGEKFVIDAAALIRVLRLCDTFSEWEQADVFEMLAQTPVKEQLDEKNTLELLKEKLFPKLAHSNRALIIASAKLLLCFAERLGTEKAEVERLLGKVLRSLVAMLNESDEVTFVICHCILLMDSSVGLVGVEPASFYCRSEEALFVKLLKLKVIRRLAKRAPSANVLDELFTYFRNPDPAFAQAAVETFFKVAETRAADPALRAKVQDKLGELAPLVSGWKTPVVCEALLTGLGPYVLEAMARGIDSVLESKQLGLLLDAAALNVSRLRRAEAKVGLLTLLGLIPQKSPEAAVWLADKFLVEDEGVQMALLDCLVRLYLADAGSAADTLTTLFESVSQDCANPLVRDQAFLYWRLLTQDPEAAKEALSFKDAEREEPHRRKVAHPKASLRLMGSFANYFLNKKNTRIPPFLLHDNYPRKLKSKQKFETLSALDKRLFVETSVPGKRGRAGLEISGKVEQRGGDTMLLVDLRNASNIVQEIQTIEVASEALSFVIDSSVSRYKGHNVQKNEFCALELKLTLTSFPSTSPTSLHFDVTIGTSLDEHSFKIPFLVNLVLNPLRFEFTESQVESLIRTKAIQPAKLELETYEENMQKIFKLFEANRLIKSSDSNSVCARVGDEIICALRFLKKSDTTLQVDLWSFDHGYEAHLTTLITHLINN